MQYVIRSSRARMRWVCPRLKQLRAMAICALDPVNHPWARWRVETEEWFEYVDGPELGAWRRCRRCQLLQHVVKVNA